MMDPEYIVPNLPFPYPVTYEELLKMCEYFTKSLKSSTLDTNKESDYGYNLYPQK